MTDVHKLIDSILSDPRLANSRAFSGKMYEDEPMLRTGSSDEELSSSALSRHEGVRETGLRWL